MTATTIATTTATITSLKVSRAGPEERRGPHATHPPPPGRLRVLGGQTESFGTARIVCRDRFDSRGAGFEMPGDSKDRIAHRARLVRLRAELLGKVAVFVGLAHAPITGRNPTSSPLWKNSRWRAVHEMSRVSARSRH